MGDYDECPCSGVHVKNTNEIGRFKVVSSGFENGIMRLRFKLEEGE
ncbi:MAG TPA: alanine-tRNA synthetase second additional domain-containing protein [Ignavibacteriales bacterium]|nr:alanine-tRNA synthetase second additional domain-containing protein [Ignavibacteriales bacterium]